MKEKILEHLSQRNKNAALEIFYKLDIKDKLEVYKETVVNLNYIFREFTEAVVENFKEHILKILKEKKVDEAYSIFAKLRNIDQLKIYNNSVKLQEISKYSYDQLQNDHTSLLVLLALPALIKDSSFTHLYEITKLNLFKVDQYPSIQAELTELLKKNYMYTNFLNEISKLFDNKSNFLKFFIDNNFEVWKKKLLNEDT